MPVMTSDRKKHLKKLLKEFKVGYSKTSAGATHLRMYEKERKEVKVVFKTIKAKRSKGENYAEDVLRHLLPHFNNAPNRVMGYRISTWPVITKDIKKWYENVGWQEKKNWPQVTEAVFKLIDGLVTDKDQRHIDEFKNSPYCTGFQSGILSPVLYCLDSELLVINSKNKRTVNYLLQKKVIDTRIRNYLQNIAEIRRFLRESGIPEFKSYDMFDMFCHWMCTKRLGGYALQKKNGKNAKPPPEEQPPAPPTGIIEVDFKPTHTSVEWALLYMGKHSGHETWVTSSDSTKRYAGKPIGEGTVQTLPDLGLGRDVRRIVGNIDVLWLKTKKVVAAFEVEHTTNIQTGLTRLNDLILSAPNLSIDLYIVIPNERSGKLEKELSRPSFHDLRGKVKYLPYSAIEDGLLATQKILELGGILKRDFLMKMAKSL